MLKKVVASVGIMLMVMACDPLDQYRNKSDIHLYQAAMELFEYGRHERAAKVFEEVDLQHASSPLAPKSLLMAGYCYYLESSPESKNTNRFSEALDKFESFLRLHPQNENVPYAMYMIGMCHFGQLGDESRDQTSGQPAAAAFSNLMQRFPNSPYAADAKAKLDIIFSYAARKNIYVAEILIEEGRYAAAIDRLNHAIKLGLDKDTLQQANELLRTCYTALKLGHLAPAQSTTVTP